MLLRAEAWTLPTAATFEKIVDVPMLAGSSGSRELSSYSDNTLIVASTWGGFDDIRKSFIRIFDGDTIIDEHEVKRIAKTPQRPTQFQVSGPQANGLVEKLVIYPRTDSIDAQDWIWGGDNQLPPLGLGDLNNVNEEWHLHTVSDPFALTVDGQATSSLSTPTAKQLEAALQALSNVNDVTVDGTGIDADNPFVIIFYDPPDPTTVTVSTGTGTLDKQQEGGLGASPITHSQYADQRVDVANHGTYGSPPIIPITQSNLDTDATWALQVNATGQYAGSQAKVNVTPGQTYQAHIRVKPSVAGSYRLVIRDIYENLIKATSPFEVSLTAGSYQDLTISDIVIPDGVTEVIMRVAVVSSAPAEIGTFWVNWEAASFKEGLAATTFTEIVRLLLEDAQARGAYEFLDPDFTDTTDTAGNVLEDESFTAFAFSNLGHVMADGSDLGYKWRIRPKATPVGALTHDLQVYLEGEVEDLTASSGGPTVQTGSVDDAAVVSRSPDFTVAVGWGADGLYAEVEDTALVTEYGRIERVFDVEHLSSVASIERLLAEKFREQADNEDALSAEVPGDAQRVPLIDYAEGSKIWWAFPDEGVEKVAKTVRRVSWTHDDTASFTLQASEVLSEQAGMARAMHHLLRKFARRRRPRPAGTPILGGGGGAPTIVVAASNATDISKSKADFVCAGANDEATLNQATADIKAAGGGGRLLLTEGQFALGAAWDVPSGIKVQGMGRDATFVQTANTSSTYVMKASSGDVQDLTVIGPGWGSGGSNVGLWIDGPGIVANVNVSTLNWGIRLTDGGSGLTRVSNCYVSAQLGVSAESTGTSLINLSDIYVEANTGVRFVGTSVCKISDSVLWTNDNAVEFDGVDPIATTIVNCHLVGQRGIITDSGTTVIQLQVDNCEFNVSVSGVEVTATSVQISDSAIFGPGSGPGIEVTIPVATLHGAVKIDGCTVDDFQGDGITVIGKGEMGTVITGNVIKDVHDHGIRLDDTSFAVVAGNTLDLIGDGSTRDTDAIHLSGDSDENLIEHNRITPQVRTRYGVNIAASTCDDNVVVGNVLGDPGAYDTSTALNDSGTGTVLTYPGHATYGDNFTA